MKVRDKILFNLLLPVFLTFSTISTLEAAGLTPSAPSNLQGSIENGIASIEWDVPDDDDMVVGYNIYINNQYASTVFSNNFSIEVLPDTRYAFSVVAFDQEPRNFSPGSDTLTLPASLVPDDLTIPPSVPEGLSGEIADNQITLTWEPSTDDEAVQGYNVYRDNQYLTTVQSPSFTGENAADESHSWYVVAFDIRTNFSARSERIVLPDQGPVDTTIPPSVPTGLTGELSSGNALDTVTLSWEPSADDQAVAGYNIYQNRQYIATRFSTTYTGSVEAGSSNSFQIASFDFDNNFSSLSDSLVLPAGSEEVDPGVPPSTPADLSGETTTADGETQVQLTWTPSTGPVNVSGYNIYRNNEYRSTVFTNTYTDTVTSGVAFSYSVVAFDNFGNFSPRSAPLNLLGDENQPPFFSDLTDQVLQVGVPWELILRPVDIDGGAVGILVGELPAGMQFIDNLDGTRSLVWTPASNDTGSYSITVSAFDLQDTDLRTSQTITVTVSDDDAPVDAPFALSIESNAYNLPEGDATGLNIPITLIRDTTVAATPVTLNLSAASADDGQGVSARFSTETLSEDENLSTLNLQLAVGVLPIQSGQRRFTLTATDGNSNTTASLTVAITPVPRDDVYLLLGQSNMVGFSEADAKQAGTGGPDERDLRIRQANVQANDSAFYPSDASYVDTTSDFLDPAYVLAEDPLHTPADVNTLAKEGTRVGLPLSFAKAALPSTTRNIVLVPAAWSSSGFCDSASSQGSWNALPTDNPALGNTLLFDRALARINKTLQDTGGILRGILWHQGESDSTEACAGLYEQNLTLLVSELRSRIIQDARGSEARGSAANIPFVVGTMSRGTDDRGDLSSFSPEKLIVDNVHRTITGLIPFSEVVLNDDLVPSNGYPCGEGSCIHFGATALREMGSRNYDALLRAAQSAM